jgi:antitoxin MazE
MKTRLIRIGNSRGVRLPKPIIDQAGLMEDIDLEVRDGMIVIASQSVPRAGWAEAAKEMRKTEDDRSLEPFSFTKFDELEWEW